MMNLVSAAEVKISDLDWMDIIDFELRESMNDCATYILELSEFTTKFEQIIGKDASIKFHDNNIRSSGSADLRDFSGVVTQAQYTIDDSANRKVQIKVISKIGLLEYSMASAIYQKSSSIDILEKVLSRNGITLKIEKSGGPPLNATFVCNIMKTTSTFVSEYWLRMASCFIPTTAKTVIN